MLTRLRLAPPGSVRTSGDAVARVFKAADTDGDGVIKFNEFVALLPQGAAAVAAHAPPRASLSGTLSGTTL